MITRIGLAFFCLTMVGCTATGQLTSAPPPAAGTSSYNYDLAQPTAPLPSPTLAASNVQQLPAATAAPLPTATGVPITAPNPDPLASATQTMLPTAPPTVPPAAAANPTFTPVVPVTGPVGLIPLDQLLDYDVADSSGALIGDVDDVIIDLSQAAGSPGGNRALAPYIVISSNVNDDWLFPVPWQFIQIRPEWRAIILPTGANQFLSAPGFHEDAWPVGLPAEWRAALLRYWQNPAQNTAAATPVPPALGAFTPVDYIRAKDLLDMDVVDPRGFELGEIKDIAIDWANSQPGPGVESAQLGYVIIDRDDSLGIGNESIPIPWNRIQLNLQQEIALLNMPPETLRTAPAFADISWPDLYSEPWVTDLNRFWGAVQ